MPRKSSPARSVNPLEQYNAKRDFNKTPEPKGAAGRQRSAKRQFLVQKHAARRLHFDFRLEWNGVLLSWAVTRGPSPDPSQKRLAVRTEDHPLSYADFEGTIPKGEYGGGTVMLWDRGDWEPLNDPAAGLQSGKLHFRLYGERMQGGWVLVRMHGKKNEKRENWLLIKERDADAVNDADALTEEFNTSVASGREMQEIAEAKQMSSGKTKGGQRPSAQRQNSTIAAGKPTQAAGAKNGKKKPRVTAMPAFCKPQLATLVDSAPAGDEWLHEKKFDGYRSIAAIAGPQVRCYTRSGKDWTEKFASVAAALAKLPCDSALLDGEIVAPEKAQTAADSSAFSALQAALTKGAALDYMVFDLLQLDGTDYRAKPQLERKELLQALLKKLPEHAPVHYSEHVLGSGPEVFKSACAAGGEGIIAKRATAPYRHRRTRDWLKVKCTRRQEFVIGGYSPSAKRGRPFASLLLGSFENDKLRYRGRVGTGFSTTTFAQLAAAMRPLARKTAPFEQVPSAIARKAQWLSPKLVAEIEFTELTHDGHVRHAAFAGVRGDKAARQVTLEQPVKTPVAASNELHGVKLSHPERVIFPKQGLSKRELAEYYAAVQERMLPLIADFPVSLVRCPRGVDAKCFFQKHAGKGLPAELKQVPIVESNGKIKKYLYVNNVAGLIAGVQMGTLEFHLWGSRLDMIEKPARLVFDLDPDATLEFNRVLEAAELVRGGLEMLGLNSVPLVTGGKGVHVVAPLRRTADWSLVKAFAKTFAQHLANEFPERYTATMAKTRRKGKVFIDWLRNERGATAIAPYSTRAREGAPVATPVSWEELQFLNSAAEFTPSDVVARLNEPDPWLDYCNWQQSVTAKMLQAFSP